MVQLITDNGNTIRVRGNRAGVQVSFAPTQYSIDTTFECTLNDSVSQIKKQGDKYVLAGGFNTVNGNNSIEGNVTNYLISIHKDTGYFNPDFNIRGGFNSLVKDLTKTSTGWACFGTNATSYQNNTIGKLCLVKDNGDYDTNSDNLGAGFTNSWTSTNTQKTVGTLSDGSIIVCSKLSDIIYKGVTYGRVIKILSTGDVDTTFMTNIGTGPSSSSNIGVYVNSDDTMFFYGSFTSWNSNANNRIVKINSNGTIDTSFVVGTGFSSTVYKVVCDGTFVFCAGNFNTWKGGSYSKKFAKLDMSGNIATGWVTTGGSSFGVDISVNGTDVYIIGMFTSYNGGAVNRFAKIDYTTGAVDAGFTVGTGLSTASFTESLICAVDNGCIIFPNNTSYTRQGTTIPGAICKIGTDGSLVSTFGNSMPDTSSVYAIESDGDYVYIAGTGIRNEVKNFNAKALHHCVRIRDTGGKPLPYAWTRDYSYRGVYGDNGTYAIIGNQLDGILVKSTLEGVIDDTYTGNVEDLRDIYVDTSLTVAVGNFTTANSVAHNYIIGLDSTGATDSGFNIGTGFDATAQCIIKTTSGKYLVGGNFSSYNGHTTSKLALINTDGSADTSFTATSLPNVSCIVEDTDGTFWVGCYGSTYLYHISATGTALSYTVAINDEVNAIALYGGNIIIGGWFTEVDSTATNYLAIVDKSGNLVQGFGAKLNDYVYALLVDGTKLVLGGDFTEYDGTEAKYIARIHI